MLPRLCVLGHEEHAALPLMANLMNKFGKVGGVGEVNVGIRLDAMPIAAADEKHVPLQREPADGTIFVPVAQAIEFERVQPCTVSLQKLVHEKLVLLFADEIEIPHGVIEDNEHIRLVVERDENLSEPIGVWVRCVILENP